MSNVPGYRAPRRISRHESRAEPRGGGAGDACRGTARTRAHPSFPHKTKTPTGGKKGRRRKRERWHGFSAGRTTNVSGPHLAAQHGFHDAKSAAAARSPERSESRLYRDEFQRAQTAAVPVDGHAGIRSTPRASPSAPSNGLASSRNICDEP